MSSTPPSSTAAAKRKATPDAWFTPGKLLLVLVLFLGAMYSDVMFGGKAFFYRDAGAFNYPMALYWQESFKQGEMPMWNPLNNCGTPFFAQWNGMVLYPLSLLNVLGPLPQSIEWFSFVHFLIAGAGMYFLARRWTENRLAASAAALFFAWNGMTLHSIMYPNSLAAFGWMPWVVLLMEKAAREGGKQVLLAGLAGTMQMLTGVPEIILTTWIFVGLLFVLEMVRAQEGRGKILLRTVLAGLIVTGLTAVQIMPFLDLLAHSQRDKSYATVDVWAMPFWGWANFIVPLFHASPSILGVFTQDEQQWTSSYYYGIGALLLGGVAVWRERNARVWLLAAVSMLAVLLAFGQKGYLFVWLGKVIPILGMFRYPVKMVLLIMFALPLLGAFGLAWLQRAAETEKGKIKQTLGVLGGVLAVLVVSIIIWERVSPHEDTPFSAVMINGLSRGAILGLFVTGVAFLAFIRESSVTKFLGLGLLLLHGVDIATHAPNQSPVMNAKGYWPVPLVMPAVPQVGESRAFMSPALQEQMRTAGHPDHDEYFLIQRLSLFALCNIYDRVPKVNGMFSLYIKEWADVEKLLNPPDGKFPEPLANFISASVVSYPNPQFAWESRPRALPMATIGQAPEFVTPEEALQKIGASSFTPSVVVYLPKEAEATVPKSAPVPDAQVVSKEFSAQKQIYRVKTPAATQFVLSQTWYHPWQAYLDGQPVPIWRANYAFQSVSVPAGEHEIKLVYEDKTFRLGRTISLATLGVVLLAGVVLWRRKKPVS